MIWFYKGKQMRK